MNCPICKQRNISPAHILGHSTSAAKAKAARKNAKLGGRPKGKGKQ